LHQRGDAPFETIRSSETSDIVAPSGLRVSCASRSKRASVVLNSLRSLAFSAFSIRVAQESSRSQMRNSRWAPSIRAPARPAATLARARLSGIGPFV